jgi:hypothetical protein
MPLSPKAKTTREGGFYFHRAYAAVTFPVWEVPSGKLNTTLEGSVFTGVPPVGSAWRSAIA